MRLRAAALALLIAIAAVAALAGAAPDDPLPRAKAESVGMSSKRLERITRYIQDHIDRGEIAGGVTLVARRGKVVHLEAQGHRDREENAPMQPDTIFSLRSGAWRPCTAPAPT